MSDALARLHPDSELQISGCIRKSFLPRPFRVFCIRPPIPVYYPRFHSSAAREGRELHRRAAPRDRVAVPLRRAHEQRRILAGPRVHPDRGASAGARDYGAVALDDLLRELRMRKAIAVICTA